MGELINIYTDISIVGLILIGILIYIIILIVLAALKRVAFVFVQKNNCSYDNKKGKWYYLVIISSVLLIVIWGYCNTKVYTDCLKQVKNNLEEKINIEINGLIYDIEEKEKSIYIYVDKARAKLDEKRIIELDKVLLIKSINNGNYNDIQAGKYISAEGEYKEFRNPRNEGGFDEEKYYASIGVMCKLIISDYIVIYDESIKSVIHNKLFKLKNILSDRLDEITKEKYSAIYKGILLGDKSKIDENTLDLYKISGISHILSISGLHISLIGYFIYKQLRKYRGFLCSTIIAFVVVYLYGVMIGAGFSTKRAVIMFLISLLANMIGRTYDLLTALFLAGIIIIVDNPMAIFNTGLLLSFVAILGIEPLYKLISKILEIKNKAINTFFTSLCINAVTMPIIINSYHEISVYSAFVNVIILSFAGYMVGFGVVGLILSFVNFKLGTFFIYPGCIILKIYEFICEKVAILPGAVRVVSYREIERICVYYFIFGLSLTCFYRIGKANGNSTESAELNKEYAKRRVIRYFSVIMCMIFSFMFLIYTDNEYTTIKMIDVGQGDSIFINDDGISILIDAGSSSQSGLAEYAIIPFLKYNGVSEIKYLFLTHSDTDHGGSFIELMKYKINSECMVKNLVLPDIADELKDDLYIKIEKTAKEEQINIIYLSRGINLKYSNSVIECLWPLKKDGGMDKNSLSMVLKYKKNNFSMLFTGDLTKEAEERMIELQKGNYLKANVLKVGHHGSKDSSSKEFLELIKPKMALISCGENNRYGHPHKETLDRINDVECKIFSTSEVGQITVNVEEDKFSGGGFSFMGS